MLLLLHILLGAAPSARAHPADFLDPQRIEEVPVQRDGTWSPFVQLDPLDDPQALMEHLESIAAAAPPHALHVDPWVDTPSGPVRLEDLLPEPPPVPVKDPPRTSAQSAPANQPGRADGALSGRSIYLSQCHGFIWYESISRFSTQRPNLFDTVEDLHNPEGMNQFLAPYLENAGGAVFTVKERDHNPEMVIVDNDDPPSDAYREIGEGFTTNRRGWGTPQVVRYGDEPFRVGDSRRVPSDSGGRAVFTLTPPRTGEQAIYVAWVSGSDHTRNARYRITHPGGVFERTFDQTVHGSTWQYVDTLWLDRDEPVTIEVYADDRTSGQFLSIDAARIGGGSAIVERFNQLTGRPRWEEGAVLATQFNGAPKSIYDAYNDRRNGNDVVARSRWASWESPPGEDALYLSWHSNASAGGSSRGTVTYIYEGNQGPATPGSYSLATSVQSEMVDAFQLLWLPEWQDRGVRSAPFGEVNPAHNNDMPAALVELAFHDNATDTAYLKHPAFRRDAARAMYRGIVRYFADRDGVEPVFLPEPPHDLALAHGEGGELTLSWAPGPTGAPFGDDPTGYLVQTSPNGYAWDEGFAVSGTSTVLQAEPGQVVFARVIATNDGGQSFASEVLSARRSPSGSTPVLVVGAFDRFETGQLDWENLPWTVGRVRRLNSHAVNPYRIVVPHGQAIADAGWFYDSISDERLSRVDLSRYRLVVWATGEESTVDETFSTEQQELLRPWWEQGGAIWASGAEILWDLDHRGTPGDRAFASEVLGASMQADSANTRSAYGVGLLDGLDLSFPDATSPYPIEWPDELSSDRPVIASYDTGTTAAILGERVALFGFPFESIGDPAVRAEVAARLLPALVPNYTPPDVPGLDPEDPDTPHGDAPPRRRIGELRGCGCTSAATAPGRLWIGLLSLVFFLRRRRPSAHVCTPESPV